MTQYLPANLLALFTARPPIPFKPPPDGLKKRKNETPIIGLTDFLRNFETTAPPPPTKGERREQREERKRQEKKDYADSKLEEKVATWDPHSDTNAVGDPFKTLFVGRIKYETSENKLRREMEAYGPVRNIAIVFNHNSKKPRGYAFVEFEHERDMHSAYKHADGKKIDGRRIVVDVERGRTVKSWRPRRLGGGLGGTRRGGPEDNIRHSGRVDQWEGKERERGGGEDRDRDRERDRSERRERGDRDRDREEKRKRSRSPRDRKDRDRDRERRRDRDRGDRDKDRERSDRGDRDKDRDRERSDRDRDRGDREKRDRGESRDRRRDRDERREEEYGGDAPPSGNGEKNHYDNEFPYRSAEDGEIKQEEVEQNNYHVADQRAEEGDDDYYQ